MTWSAELMSYVKLSSKGENTTGFLFSLTSKLIISLTTGAIALVRFSGTAPDRAR